MVLVGHNYKWLLLWLERHNFFLTNAMLFSLPLSLAANAAGIANLLIVIALLGDNVLGRRWHFLQTTSTLSEDSSGAPNLLKLSAHRLLASYTHAHPSIHVTSITVTRTHVCNTVSDTFPALT